MKKQTFLKYFLMAAVVLTGPARAQCACVPHYDPRQMAVEMLEPLYYAGAKLLFRYQGKELFRINSVDEAYLAELAQKNTAVLEQARKGGVYVLGTYRRVLRLSHRPLPEVPSEELANSGPACFR